MNQEKLVVESEYNLNRAHSAGSASNSNRPDCPLGRNTQNRHSDSNGTTSHNSPIKTWVIEERPRELLIHKGARYLSPAKLMAIVLQTGSRGLNAEELSRRLLNKFGTLRKIDSGSVADICLIKGIGPAKAARIKASFELGKRLCNEETKQMDCISSPQKALSYVSSLFGPYLRDAGKEFFCITLLDRKNKPIKSVEVSKGSVSSAFVNPREVMMEALIAKASGLILVHNHPSGDSQPSTEDISITRQLEAAADLLGIDLLDHIIIGKNRVDYYSFRANGIIPSGKG